ncbi:MAG: helix-hairpin-helix domain-containing protein [Vagococcus sp.]|uniref:helix-hairpin-helix domain-containing protein n=1 Tax=Vagococcus sp. TaxID=1933889 RepID=UPI002FCBE437
MKQIKKYVKKENLPWGILLLVAVALGTKFFLVSESNQVVATDDVDVISSTENKVEESEELVANDKMYVDIKGAVKKPGMYEVSSAMRVLNVVELAGGLMSDADDKQINFSEKLEDQMIIYVPKEGEEIPELKVHNEKNEEGNKRESKESNKVNINQAEKEELMTLNGVGEKKAEKIIEYREENGSFKTIEDLKNVNGFGEKTFESLKESIIV